MSRSLWRCRNRDCPVPHGAVLGKLTRDRGLVVNVEVGQIAVHFDSRKAVVWCPCCGGAREFRDSSVFVTHVAPMD